MDKIVNIQNIDPNTFQLQTYSQADESLILNTVVDANFDPTQDYLEYFILDLNKNIVFSNTAGYPNYRLEDNIIILDPQNDLEIHGFTDGQYYTVYNFLRRKLSSSVNSTFYIQEISTDRTEVRLNTTSISDLNLVTLTQEFASEIALSPYGYMDFYLNFGDNRLVIANNIALDSSVPGDPTVLIKLYEPLPTEFDVQSQCWVVEQIALSEAYQIELTTVFDFTEQLNYISGPNFNITVQDQVNNSTQYANKNTLDQNTSTLGSGSLLYQINSILAEKGIEINIDYSDYSNFVHFSSAQTRLENFYYKLALIEEYTVSSSFTNSSPTNTYTSASQKIWDNKINDIITNFDGYEYYLYFNSESHAWPKTNSTAPYINYSVNSPTAISWFTTQSYSASYFDSENNDALLNTIPTYLREDSNNDQYFLFTQMIGQHFDNVWVYLKDITNKFDADNRLNYGISKDIVAQAIRDLGVNIYQNNFSSTDIYSALLGLTVSGSNLNIPYSTGSLPTPTGYEYINTFITASDPNALEPLDDVNKEIYKRIYHNLPYLLKKKGTVEGLRTLINIYGIPSTIVRINEFGGKSTTISNNWDNYQDQFNYAFFSTGSGYVQFDIPFSSSLGYGSSSYGMGIYGGTSFPTNSKLSLEFRFKTTGIPTTSSFSQSLAIFSDSGLNIVLEYTGSGYATGSYNGAPVDPYNEYGTLKFIDSNNNSASIYLPFFDGGWWSVLATADGNHTSSIYAKNSIYDGEDGNLIGFQGSSSVSGGAFWVTNSQSVYLSYPTDINLAGKTYTPFSGSFQELRFYKIALDESKFDDYVMNPFSIEGNQIQGPESSLKSLIFRAPLGSVLDISGSIRTSIHPGSTTNPILQPFNLSGSIYYLSGSYSFIPNYEVNYQDQFHAGVKNAVTEKIRIVSESLPSGNTLSQYISIQQQTTLDETFTKDINYVEVAFSPQDEVNDDIISQLGSFNIGNYIGDPRQVSSSLTYYPDFNRLRDEYFSKYTHNYNLWDYIRLIKFYDNSLFKMIQDFTPARAGLASGIVVKQTLLERNKYPLPQMTTNSEIAFVGSPTNKTINIAY